MFLFLASLTASDLYASVTRLSVLRLVCQWAEGCRPLQPQHVRSNKCLSFFYKEEIPRCVGVPSLWSWNKLRGFHRSMEFSRSKPIFTLLILFLFCCYFFFILLLLDFSRHGISPCFCLFLGYSTELLSFFPFSVQWILADVTFSLACGGILQLHAKKCGFDAFTVIDKPMHF